MTGRDMTVLGGATGPSAENPAVVGVAMYAGVECGVSGMWR